MKHTALPRPFECAAPYFGGDQSWFSKKRDVATGCGPVALTNLLVYALGKPFSREAFQALQEETLAHLRGPVLSPLSFCRGARSLFRAHGLSIGSETLWCFGPNIQSQKVRAFVRECLSAGHPVALLLGPNRSRRAHRRDFSNHWVLITDLWEEEETFTLGMSSWGAFHKEPGEALLSGKWFAAFTVLLPLKTQRPL
ncbi:hypothetical protein ABB02_01629 [Clostridiaceae bacterium JG1575]|nr:hypothetical protein ABB02_01629 [Clostridiaceae bacterium JG1575]